MRWWEGDQLNSGIHQGDQKKFTHTVGGSLKIYKKLEKFSNAPLPVKNDTSLNLKDDLYISLNPLIVKPFWLTNLAKGGMGWLLPPFLKS